MMSSSIYTARVGLLVLPLTVSMGVAYAGGLAEATEGSVVSASNVPEGFHVAGSLSQGLAYFDYSNADKNSGGTPPSADTADYWKWVAPSFASQIGVTYGVTDVASQWGTHGINMRGRFNLDYSQVTTAGDMVPKYEFIIASDNLGSLEFGSNVLSSVGGGFVVGKLPTENLTTPYTLDYGFKSTTDSTNTKGVLTAITPKMLFLSGHSDDGSMGARYTTPGLFKLTASGDKGDGLQLFVGSRNEQKVDYGASYIMSTDGGMKFKLAGAFFPKTTYTAWLEPGFYTDTDKWGTANAKVTSEGRGAEYLLSVAAPADIGLAVTGYLAKVYPGSIRNEAATYVTAVNSGTVPGFIEWWDPYKKPQEMGVNASFQRDISGMGDTIIRLGWAEDRTHNLLFENSKSLKQRHIGVAIEQPLAKGLNVLFGWNQYKVTNTNTDFDHADITSGSTSYASNRGSGVPNLSFPSNSNTTKMNAQSVFIMGLEYEIAT